MLDDAIAALRKMTRGSKGNRADYIGTLTTRDASALVAFIDVVKPFYDGNAITPDEVRFLSTIRALPSAGLKELADFECYLCEKYARAGASGSGT